MSHHSQTSHRRLFITYCVGATSLLYYVRNATMILFPCIPPQKTQWHTIFIKDYFPELIDFDQNYTRKLWTILGLSFGIPARRWRAKNFNLFWTLNDLMIIYIVKICNLMINQMIRIFPDPEFVINHMIRIFLDPEFVINQMIRIFEISRWWSIIWQVWLIINTSWSIKI